jgi:hypothetical protein
MGEITEPVSYKKSMVLMMSVDKTGNPIEKPNGKVQGYRPL